MSSIHNDDPNPNQEPTHEADVPPDPIFVIHRAAMREMDEPRDGAEPTPVSYILLCFAALMWGGWYIGTYAGTWSADGLAERATAGAAITAPAQNPMELGKEVFGVCVQCHQENGRGVPENYPPLAGSEYVLGDKRKLAALVLRGLGGDVTVAGKHFNSQMPAWDNRDDEEIAAVLTYIRNSWGNKADPLSKEFVAAVRKETEGKGEWRPASLDAFAATPPPAAPVAAPPTAATPQAQTK
ncbi:MAG: cytochrome c [Acidobacteria bacterium]|nr:cytochrome c [Acidobacteriota bacterium]